MTSVLFCVELNEALSRDKEKKTSLTRENFTFLFSQRQQRKVSHDGELPQI